MTRKEIIALADAFKRAYLATKFHVDIRKQRYAQLGVRDALDEVIKVCKDANPRFKEDRFRAYIAGECGPNGGAVKAKPAGDLKDFQGNAYRHPHVLQHGHIPTS